MLQADTPTIATLRAENVAGEVIYYQSTKILVHSKAEHRFVDEAQADMEM